MTDPQLTAEEAQAIREAVSGGQPKGPVGISLAAGDRQAQRQLPLLRPSWDELATRVRAEVGREFRAPMTVAAEPLALSGPKAMAKEAQTWLCGAALKDAHGEVLAWLGLMPRLGFHLIEMAFGAPNEPSSVLPTRLHLTAVEQQTLWPFLMRLAEHMRAVLKVNGAEQVRIEPMPTPVDLGKIVTQDAGLVGHISFPLGQEPAVLGFIFAPKLLDALAERQHEAQAHALAPRDAMASSLGSAEVNVVAFLGRARLSVGDVAALSAGQVVWLEHTQHDPIEVRVEGLVKFHANPMQRSGAVGVQIVERV